MISKPTCSHASWLRVPPGIPRKAVGKACFSRLAYFLCGYTPTPCSGCETFTLQIGLLHLGVSGGGVVLLWKFLRQKPLCILLFEIPHQQGRASHLEDMVTRRPRGLAGKCFLIQPHQNYTYKASRHRCQPLYHHPSKPRKRPISLLAHEAGCYWRLKGWLQSSTNGCLGRLGNIYPSQCLRGRDEADWSFPHCQQCSHATRQEHSQGCVCVCVCLNNHFKISYCSLSYHCPTQGRRTHSHGRQ